MSPSTLLFQYFNLTTFLLLESGCKGIGFSNTSQTYLPFSFNKNETFFITYWFINAFRVNNFGKREKRENNYTLYIYACARRTRRKRIKTFHKYAGLGGAGSVKIVAASKQGHCFTHSSGSISPLWFRSYKPQNVSWFFFKSLCECFALVNTKQIVIFYLFSNAI